MAAGQAERGRRARPDPPKLIWVMPTKGVSMTDRQSVGAVAAPDVARACAAPGDVRPITQIDFARAGIVTPQMAAVARVGVAAPR